MEVVCREHTGPDSGIVEIIWCKNSMPLNYDAKIRATCFTKQCWPVTIKANHMCGLSRISARIGLPFALAVKGKQMRARTKVHDVPDSEIVTTLSSFGITRDALPTVMGGGVESNQLEWLANRRAVEMEEF